MLLRLHGIHVSLNRIQVGELRQAQFLAPVLPVDVAGWRVFRIRIRHRVNTAADRDGAPVILRHIAPGYRRIFREQLGQIQKRPLLGQLVEICPARCEDHVDLLTGG
ncbi:hypothetical protein D3C76_1336620 [compost metagenome]